MACPLVHRRALEPLQTKGLLAEIWIESDAGGPAIADITSESATAATTRSCS